MMTWRNWWRLWTLHALSDTERQRTLALSNFVSKSIINTQPATRPGQMNYCCPSPPRHPRPITKNCAVTFNTWSSRGHTLTYQLSWQPWPYLAFHTKTVSNYEAYFRKHRHWFPVIHLNGNAAVLALRRPWTLRSDCLCVLHADFCIIITMVRSYTWYDTIHHSCYGHKGRTVQIYKLTNLPFQNPQREHNSLTPACSTCLTR